MITAEATALYPPAAEGRPDDRGSVWTLAERLTPKEGWDTFLLVVGVVGVSVFTVWEAGWVATPGLFAIVLWSGLAGLVLAKARLPWPVLHLAGLALGAVLVAWQTSSLIEGKSLPGQWGDLWTRLREFYEAAATGGISTDLMPFTLVLLAAAWLLGYFSSFYVFRSTNMWVALILAGVALMTNLSFLPVGYGTRFFAFILLALLLIVRVSSLQRRERWRNAGFGVVPGRKWLPAQAAVGLTLIVVAISAFLPLNVFVSQTAVELWNLGRSPISGMEEEFGRLFSGISSKKDLSGRFFGKTLPFQGKISFNGDVVMYASSRLPSYWLARTYSEYTSKGWMAGQTQKRRVDSDTLPPPPQESLKRLPVGQNLLLTFETDDIFAGGNVGWVSRPAVVETLLPLRFEVDLRDEFADQRFPEQVQALARRIRQLDLKSPALAMSQITRLLPDDMIMVGPPAASVKEFGGPLQRITLERKAQTLSDVVTWQLQRRLKEEESYSLNSLVSYAQNDDLREAGTEYTGFIMDHYLQLPPGLPERVRDLAVEETRGARTPLDKALALQEFLRGEDFKYSQDIDKPPRDSDGVDYFLFDSAEGYSDYYASAMAVMLRSLGVPSRLAAGYAPGKPQDGRSGRRIVLDKDSHAWTQVYFPRYGWIDFEPTPNWPLPDRGGSRGASETPQDPDTGEDCIEESPTLFADRALEDCDADNVDASDEPLLMDEELELDPLPEPVAAGSEAMGPWELVARAAAIAVLLLASLWLVGWLVWTRGLSGATPAERIYTKMSRLAVLAGLRRRSHQTPIEYAMALGGAIPAIGSEAQTAAWAFAAGRYGPEEGRDADGEGMPDLDAAWRNVRNGLLGRVLRRLLLMGGPADTGNSV